MISKRFIPYCLIVLIAAGSLTVAANAQIIVRLPGIRVGSVAIGDFNHDGIPDLTAVNPNYGLGGIGFYQGDGTGNFVRGAGLGLEATVNGPVVVADFDGDGNPEVIVPMRHRGLAVVRFRGSQRPDLQWYPVGEGVTGVQFADLDGDGQLDMLVANGSLDVYRGYGAGTFDKIASYPGVDGRLVLGDFNGDGKLDVATTDSSGVNVFLGFGDGTFQPAVHTSGPFTSIAAADFNRDGKLDLVAGTLESSNVTLLLGNGDGTFAIQPSYHTGQFYSTTVVADDFNKDGNPDVAVADGCFTPQWPCLTNSAVTIMLGNGDGTLQMPTSYDSGGRLILAKNRPPKMVMTASDLDRNGTIDLIVMNALLPNFGSCRGYGGGCPATVGILLGNGDGTFQSAPVSQHFASSTSLSSLPNPSIYGQPVTFTATVVSEAPLTPTGTVRFRGGRVHGQSTLAGGVAMFTPPTMLAGSTSITATYFGDSSHLVSSSNGYLQTVNQGPTTTEVTSSPNPSVQGQTVTITATVTSPFAAAKGTVTFTTGNGDSRTVAVSGGKAQYKIATLPTGSTTIVATYNPVLNLDGGTNFSTSSGSVVQVVK